MYKYLNSSQTPEVSLSLSSPLSLGALCLCIFWMRYIECLLAFSFYDLQHAHFQSIFIFQTSKKKKIVI